MEHTTDIVIIGAGISGLFAARELSKKGKKVIVLEARNATGGRIRSVTGNFSVPVDLGPEFIHGNLPITKSLLKEAGIKFHKHEGEFYRSKDGTIFIPEDMTEGWDSVMKELKSLKKDMTLSQFLSQYFSDAKYEELRTEVTRLAEGFDAADASRISAFAVRDEWGGDSIEESYKIEGSYSLLVDFLTLECKKNNCVFYLQTEVKTVDWQNGKVKIACSNGNGFVAAQALITVSLGVLTASPGEQCYIAFSPAIPEKIAAANTIGFGPIIKVNLEFHSAFWNDKNFEGKAAQIPNFGFLNSDNEIPVWWTSAPDQPFLTGWAGGSKAAQLKDFNNDELFAKAITSLAAAMHTTEAFLKENLLVHVVSNWGKDPFTKGAYSYQTPETADAKKILAAPLANTVFFAGEALGESMGTVEAGLESAKVVVKEIKP